MFSKWLREALLIPHLWLLTFLYADAGAKGYLWARSEAQDMTDSELHSFVVWCETTSDGGKFDQAAYRAAQDMEHARATARDERYARGLLR